MGDLSVAGEQRMFGGNGRRLDHPGKHKVTVDAMVMGQKLTILQVADGEKAKNKVTFVWTDVPWARKKKEKRWKASAALHDMEYDRSIVATRSKYGLKARKLMLTSMGKRLRSSRSHSSTRKKP